MTTATTHEHTWTPAYKAVYHPAEYKDNVMRARLAPNNYLGNGLRQMRLLLRST